MSMVAIITARGGSKRIPGKNIKSFCGKPIMAYSIAAALESGLFDDVMVSTDDETIAKVARAYGASVPFMRSAKNSDDYATTADVLHEVLTEYANRGIVFAWMCCIYPTAPFISKKKLQDAFRLLQDKHADALVAVARFSYPPQRCFVVNDGYLRYQWPEFAQSRSQDLSPLYHDSGQFYFWRVHSFQQKKIDKIIPYPLTAMEVQDIDTLADWELAEMKYRYIQSKA